MIFLILEHSFVNVKGRCRMGAVEELINYIKSLTPEQTNKAVNLLPQVISTLSERVPPDLQTETLQTP